MKSNNKEKTLKSSTNTIPLEKKNQNNNQKFFAYFFDHPRYLMKNLMTHPSKAIQIELWVYFVLFFEILITYALIHAGITSLSWNFKGNELNTYIVAFLRVILSSSIALILGTAGASFYWFIRENLTFADSLKRLMFYYISVIIISLLGEVFLARIILESELKLQPFVIIAAGGLAVLLLQQAMQEDSQIGLSLPIIVFILCLSYIQGYMIANDLIPYSNQENIESPITIFLKNLFTKLF